MRGFLCIHLGVLLLLIYCSKGCNAIVLHMTVSIIINFWSQDELFISFVWIHQLLTYCSISLLVSCRLYKRL